jgi:hypothetical protein
MKLWWSCLWKQWVFVRMKPESTALYTTRPVGDYNLGPDARGISLNIVL